MQPQMENCEYMFYWILACVAKDIYVLIENFIHSCIHVKWKKKSIFYVKNKPILGGIIHLQIVTLRPGRTVNPRYVPVTDLGFGFLIWLRDVQKPQVVNSSLLAMHLRGSRTLFIPASVWNTLYSINWLLLLPFWRIWRICILCWNKCTLPK